MGRETRWKKKAVGAWKTDHYPSGKRKNDAQKSRPWKGTNGTRIRRILLGGNACTEKKETREVVFHRRRRVPVGLFIRIVA